jgi:membrane protein implicated in regulation of membrane protease activity
MPAWLIWLCVAAGLGLIEMTTLTFAAGLMAAAAVMAGVIAGLGGGLLAQAVTFAAASFAALAVVYPFATRRRVANARHRSGVEALAGRPAVVLKEVDALSGQVRIGGEVWSARAYDETLVIPAGTRVAVFEIDGATALVYPKELP